MKIQFNTGRNYDDQNGQKIVAEFKNDMVYFADLTRNIYGRFNATVLDPEDLQRTTMRFYDHGTYEINFTAYQFYQAELNAEEVTK